jgi:hypothetical protein
MLLVDESAALAYAAPRDPAPRMRTRGGLRKSWVPGALRKTSSSRAKGVEAVVAEGGMLGSGVWTWDEPGVRWWRWGGA